MKNLIIILLIGIITFSSVSCTENTRAKNFGGKMTINLNKNEKLIMITWKNDNIWYLTRPMNANDFPETYKFKEDSTFGIANGTIIIIESK